MGTLLPDRRALSILIHLLDDDDVAVEQEAAEALVLFGGIPGLSATMEVIGRREADPDADYIAYKLREIQILQSIPILQNARAIARQNRSAHIRSALEQLEDLFGAHGDGIAALRPANGRDLSRLAGEWGGRIGLDDDFERAVEDIPER